MYTSGCIEHERVHTTLPDKTHQTTTKHCVSERCQFFVFGEAPCVSHTQTTPSSWQPLLPPRDGNGNWKWDGVQKLSDSYAAAHTCTLTSRCIIHLIIFYKTWCGWDWIKLWRNHRAESGKAVQASRPRTSRNWHDRQKVSSGPEHDVITSDMRPRSLLHWICKRVGALGYRDTLLSLQ